MSANNLKRIVSDEEKHESADGADEEIHDEESSLGHAPKDVEDIDETLQSVGLPSDENGPRELNSQEALEEAEKR